MSLRDMKKRVVAKPTRVELVTQLDICRKLYQEFQSAKMITNALIVSIFVYCLQIKLLKIRVILVFIVI